MHGIAIAILKYGYLNDNTALSRYSASCGPDHDSQMKKKKVVLAARLDSLLQQTCMALFLNIFIVTSNSSVSIYRSILAAATVFPACYRETTFGKADHPWQPYLVRGDHLRQHNLPQIVRGDQLWRGTNCGMTGHTLKKPCWRKCVIEIKNFDPIDNGGLEHPK